MYFHGARFSNYEAWLSDPIHIKPSAQVVWPVVGQEILNGDVGGGFQGIQITSGFFQLWRASGITSELQLYTTAIGGLVMAAAMFFAGWFHYHKAAPKLEWFQNVESMLNHHLGGLLGLGSLGWAGHQIHVSLPVNKLLDAGVDPKEIPLPHDLLLNRQIMADLYPSFAKGLAPFFTLQWGEYSDFLTFKGGLNPVTGGLWLSDTAHHHLAIAVLFLVAGHMYRTNWGIGHNMKEILEAHKGPFTGEGHVGLYEILTTSWHAQLAINLALFGSLSIIVAWIYKWVTLNPTICWNVLFAKFNAYPQVLKLMYLSASLNLSIGQQFFTEMVSNNLNITLWDNLVGRNNQQETNSFRKLKLRLKKLMGSSETLRGTFFSHINYKHNNTYNLSSLKGFKEEAKTQNFLVYNFQSFVNASEFAKKGTQIPQAKQKFLEWFIGFSEGDGSFGFYFNTMNFVINQAELPILYKIRKELDFGKVRTYKQEGSTYARYEVKKKEHIYKLIQLFNGNIHLEKVHKRFTYWVAAYNKKYKLSEKDLIIVKPRLKSTDINLNTAWLSGFWDAEGGFHASITKQKKGDGKKTYLRLRLRTYVDQKGEYDIFEQIQNLFEVSNITVRSPNRKLYRVDCCTKKTLAKTLIYFEKHKVRTKKHIVYAMWIKLVRLFLESKHLNNFLDVELRVQRIQEKNQLFKHEKTVLSNLPSKNF